MKVDSLKYWFDPHKITLPINPNELFENNNPVYLEIGFGGGEFLIENAIENPGNNYIGLELSVISLVKIQHKMLKNGIENARVALVDANFAIKELFEDESLSGIYMNFPCPWPKKRHAYKRLSNPEFVNAIGSVLKLNGSIQIYTDVLEFVNNFRESLELSGCFVETTFDINPSENANTRYESKWLEEHRNIYRLRTNKIKEIKKNRRIAGGADMPHKWIKSEPLIDELKEKVNINFKEDRVMVIYKNIMKDISKESYFIDSMAIDEDKFQQRFFIELEKREKGWIIRLHSQGLPFRTPAVKYAIYNLAEILEGTI